jgi:hypothetical protein
MTTRFSGVQHTERTFHAFPKKPFSTMRYNATSNLNYLEATADSLSKLLESGECTSEDLVSAYLQGIKVPA